MVLAALTLKLKIMVPFKLDPNEEITIKYGIQQINNQPYTYYITPSPLLSMANNCSMVTNCDPINGDITTTGEKL